MHKFFSLVIADKDRWYLEIEDFFRDGSPVDIWQYWRCGQLEEPKPVPFRIKIDGKRVDFNRTAFSATVVSSRMGEVISCYAPDDIQRIPAIVDGEEREWEVLNVLACPDCIDHDASIIQYFPANHPTSGGEPRGVIKLVIDPVRVGNHHIFHPRGWTGATIVTEALKIALQEICITGVEYVPLETPT